MKFSYYSDYQLEDFLADPEFLKLVKGSESRERQIYFDQWIKSNPSNFETAQLAKEIILSLKSHSMEPDQDDYDEVMTKLLAQQSSKKTISEKPFREITPIWRWAAVLLIVSGLSALVYHSSETVSLEPVAFEQTIIKSNQKGQRSTMMLPDGTKVVLNGESSLTYLSDFTGSVREVSLEGEAFFDVVRDERKPFIINTNDIKVRVLGTSFNVKSYPEEDKSVVSVATGKVNVLDQSNTENQLDILPGEKITYFKVGTKRMQKSAFDFEDEIGWTKKLLIFKESEFDQITTKLSRWYGIDFEIKNKQIDFSQKFSGRYEDPTIQGVLAGISYVYGFDYEIRQNKIIIK